MAEIKNLAKAAKRIKKAIKDNENIILFGDGDLDGTTAVVLLEESIKNLGGDVNLVYFPDRENEGYGLNKSALDFLRQFSPALLIILDCGIGSFEELKVAKGLGLDPIVIDHHEILVKVPSSGLIVDPKQPRDKYPFKHLTTVSIVYQLAQLLLGAQLSSNLNQSFLELGALGTIADMMPEEDINKSVIEGGLSSIFFSFRPGLRAILEAARTSEDSPRRAVQKLVSILNITAIKTHLTESYLLLNSDSQEEAKKLASRLLSEAEQRRGEIYEITKEVLQRAEESTAPIIFEGSPEWGQVLTGSIASRVCNKHKKPTFIFRIGPKLSRGSVRAPREVNSVEALSSCAFLLEVYGGHPPAAGFAVKNENLEELEKCLVKYFSNCRHCERSEVIP